MRVFVTGASGWIGSAVVPDLLAHGHEVVGLARSDASADAITAAGAEVHRGSLRDLDSLRVGARDADGVIHLAYIHDDFSDFQENARVDRAAVEALGEELVGSDRPFVLASGTLGLAPGRLGTERDMPDTTSPMATRALTARYTLDLADRGVRSSVVRLSPTVHGEGDHGFMAMLIGLARQNGVAGFAGDGQQRWTAVHRLDAAPIFRLALEQAPAGSVFHAVADEGVRMQTVAEIIGRHVGVPAASFAPEEATERLGFFATVLNLDSPASSTITQEQLGWTPTHPSLVEDLEAGHYFR